MSKYRRNAVVLDFNVMPVRPDIETVSKFIAKGLTLDLKRTKNLQFNNSRNHVIIELGSPEEASELADQHNLKHNLRWSGRNFAIPIFVEDNAIQVRVHDLPPHMPNDLITSHLEAYGEVRSIRNEVWRDYFPGIPNGVRAVRMVLSKPIPSFIQVESDLAYISYNQQVRTCRHCAKPLHNGKKCDEIKKTTITTTTAPQPPAQPPPAPKLSATTIETAPASTPPKTATTTTINPTTSVENQNTQPTDQTKFQSNQMDISPEDDDDDETEKEAKSVKSANNTNPAKRRSRRNNYRNPYKYYDD